MVRPETVGTPARRFSAAERDEIRRRLAAGERHKDIAAAVGASTKAVQRLIYADRKPPPAWLFSSESRLTFADREEISRGVQAGLSLPAIARSLNRAPSTISRDVALNGGRSRYRAWRATRAAERRSKRPKPRKLLTSRSLMGVVITYLRRRWSPEQISAMLRRTYPHDVSMRVSPETIYQTLYLQARGGLKVEVKRWLRSGRAARRNRGRFTGRQRINDMVLISERPAEAEDRAVPGHWEGDLIAGAAGASTVGTLVERSTRFVMLLALPNGRTAAAVNAALIERIQQLPNALKRSLTWDRGAELAEHKAFTVATGVQVYFCDPRSPWQRGSNENTNGLLRQYLPRSMDLSTVTQAELDGIAEQLNTRPRKTLDWQTPAHALAKVLQ